MRVADPSYFYYLRGGESGFKTQIASRSGTYQGTYQIGPSSLYDMIKHHPDSEASKAILDKFVLHNGYTVSSFYQRTINSKEYSGSIQREYSELCKQIASMNEQDQQDIFDHKTDNWMKRYGLTHIDFFPAFLLSNLAPALAARLQQEWDAGKGTPEETLKRLLDKVVFTGSTSDIGRYTTKAYWWNAHIDGAQVEYVTTKSGRVKIKPMKIGIDGKIDVRDVLNYYTRTLFPAVYEDGQEGIESEDLSFYLAPLARVVYLKADQDFYSKYRRHLPLLNALRTASHHVNVYDELSQQRNRYVKPFALSAHLAGNAIDLESSQLTAEQRRFAINVLEAAGFTRPWKHRSGEEYHFELTGFTDPDMTKAVIAQGRYADDLIRYASIQPPLAFIKEDGHITPYYLNRNVEISTTPFLGLVPTQKFDQYFSY